MIVICNLLGFLRVEQAVVVVGDIGCVLVLRGVPMSRLGACHPLDFVLVHGEGVNVIGKNVKREKVLNFLSG